MPDAVVEAEFPEGPDVAIERANNGHWRGCLVPGDVLVTTVEAGAVLEFRGAGGHVAITATRKV
eukprot:4234870-Lingulodinium_polyedra.AAC.1